MKLNNKLLALFEGIHFHEGIIYENGQQSIYKCYCMEHQSIEPLSYLNPNYSQPEDSQKLLQFLFEDIDMWRRFEDFAFSIKRKEGITNFIPWLFSEKTEIPKWVLLFNEWLCLEETIERFGTMICPDCNGKGSFSIGSFTCDIQTCATCMGTGKTLTLWAEEAQKSK